MASKLLKFSIARYSIAKNLFVTNGSPTGAAFYNLQFRMNFANNADQQENSDILKKNLMRTVAFCKNAEKNSFGLSFYQKKITDIMSNHADLDLRDLNEAIHLIKSDADIDFVKNALLYYQENLFKNKERIAQDNASFNFLNVLFMIKKTNKVIEMINENANAKIFSNQRIFRALYEYLLQEKRYDDLAEIFLKKLPRSIRTKKENNTEQRSIFLYDSQVELFTRSLLLQNTNESLSKFKYLIRFIEENNGTVNDQTWLRFIYLAFARDNPKLALSCLNSKKFTFEKGLNLNLKTLAFIQVRQLNDAFRLIQIMFNSEILFFPIVLAKLREVTYSIEDKEDLYEVDTLLRKIIIDSRILDHDLEEFVMQSNFFNEATSTKNNQEKENLDVESDKRPLKYNN